MIEFDDCVDEDGCVRDYPVTEVGLLQLLEGIDRATRDEEDAKSRDARRHNAELNDLAEKRNDTLEKFDEIRRGDRLPFDAVAPPTVQPPVFEWSGALNFGYYYDGGDSLSRGYFTD